MFEPVTITSTVIAHGWPAVCGVGVTSCAERARTESKRLPAMIASVKPASQLVTPLAKFWVSRLRAAATGHVGTVPSEAKGLQLW